jgi:hypothetical protein
MTLQNIHSLGDHTVVVLANSQRDASADPIILTAGATEDGVKINGDSIIRRDFMSCVVGIVGQAKLAQDKTISFAVEYQDSTDGSTWNTAVAMQTSTVAATGGTGGSTEGFKVDLPLNLYGLEKYIRFNVTPAMSATGTDTAVWAASCTLGGANQLPAAIRTS